MAKYRLEGIDSNAYNIIGTVSRFMRDEGMTKEQIKDYQKDCTSGDYDNLITKSMEIVDMLNEKYDDSEDEDYEGYTDDYWEESDEYEGYANDY